MNSLNPEELNLRIEEVESALSRVSSSIHQLEEETQHAKSDISESLEKHLAELHNRHIQLLRQVDVLYREKRNALQNQLAQCSRLLGTLTTTQQYAGHLFKNRNFIQIQGIAGVKSFGATGHLRLSLDDNALTNAITGFGKVDMDGFLVLPNEEKSQCLPARVEEYQDDDTIVLNKPLSSSMGTIEIRFPQIPKDYSYWLARKVQVHENVTENNQMEYRRTADDYKPCDVQTWLAHIQQETAAEPMEADFSSASSASESIEVISAMDCTEKAPSAATCCQQPILNVEIENLAETFAPCVIDQHKWLSPRTPRLEISVASACKANETCSSFDDCVCDTSCQQVALKNRQEKEKQLQLAYWLKSSNSKTVCDGKFQLPPQHSEGMNSSIWLRPKPVIQDPQPNKERIFPVSDKTQWLRDAATSATPKEIEKAQASVDHQLWLRCHSVVNSKDEANQQLKQTSFTDFLANKAAVNCNWLRKQQSTTPLLQAIKELKQMRINEKLLRDEELSKWLLRQF